MTGDELAAYRKMRNLRQADIAWMAGVHERNINRWENGSFPVPRSVELLLKAFAQNKINARWLVRNIPDPIP